MTLVLAVVALLIALGSAAMAFAAYRGSRAQQRTHREDAEPIPAELDAVRDEVHRLRAEAAEALRHLAVVRYDAFGDMGGHLSWSLALLDDHGDGVVLTSISGRSDARTYAKNIRGWTCDQQMSPEESEAVGYARPGR